MFTQEFNVKSMKVVCTYPNVLADDQQHCAQLDSVQARCIAEVSYWAVCFAS